MRYASIDRFIALLGLQDVGKYGNKTPEQRNHSYATIAKYEIRDAIEAAECHFAADPDFGEIMCYAVRYAIGRMTYAPFSVCQYIRPIVSVMDGKALANIAREIDEHENRADYGLGHPQIDAPQWTALRDAIREELKRREKADGQTRI